MVGPGLKTGKETTQASPTNIHELLSARVHRLHRLLRHHLCRPHRRPTTATTAAATPVHLPATAATLPVSGELALRLAATELVLLEGVLSPALTTLHALRIGLHSLGESSHGHLEFRQIQCRVTVLVKVGQHGLGQLGWSGRPPPPP